MFLFCFGISVSLQCVFLVKDRSQKFYSLILSIIIKLCLSEICDSLYRHAFSLFFNFSRRFKKIIFKRYVGIMPIQFFLVECQLNSKGKKEKESVLQKVQYISGINFTLLSILRQIFSSQLPLNKCPPVVNAFYYQYGSAAKMYYCTRYRLSIYLKYAGNIQLFSAQFPV